MNKDIKNKYWGRTLQKPHVKLSLVLPINNIPSYPHDIIYEYMWTWCTSNHVFAYFLNNNTILNGFIISIIVLLIYYKFDLCRLVDELIGHCFFLIVLRPDNLWIYVLFVLCHQVCAIEYNNTTRRLTRGHDY